MDFRLDSRVVGLRVSSAGSAPPSADAADEQRSWLGWDRWRWPRGHMFAARSGSVVTCAADTPETRDEKLVHKGFREQFGEDVAKLNDQAKVLFKVTVDDGSKSKPIVYVGVAHTGRISEVLDVFNQQYSGAAGQEGAFLLKAGYGVNPNKSAGNAFMQYGHELTFHTKVDFARLAYA